jgi:transcriptional regulator with PAS, ATPase and Fis domain
MLRVLETGTVLPVGAREPVSVDVRVVSATHRALRKEVEAGRFRADLMYRLRVIPIFLPPLRKRPGDPTLLARLMIDELNRKSRRQITTISPEALELLELSDWPGNVRELRNVLTYAYVIGEGPVLQASDLPPEVLGEEPVDRREPDEDAEAARILVALEQSQGKRGEAAAALGMSRITLWRRMKALNLT